MKINWNMLEDYDNHNVVKFIFEFE